MGDSKNQVKIFSRDFTVICLSMVFSRMVFMMQNAVFPLYMTDFLGISKTTAGLVVAAASVSSILMRPVAGGLVDSGKGKASYIVGALVYTFGVVLSGFIRALPLLFVIRFIYGLGQSTQGTSGSAMAIKLIPDSRMKEGVGYFGLTGTIAQAVGPPVALMLIAAAGYKNQFLSSGGLVVLALLGGLTITVPKNVTGAAKESENGEGDEVNNASSDPPAGFLYKIVERTSVTDAALCVVFNVSLCAIGIFLAIRANELGIANIGVFFTVQAVSLTVSRIIIGRVVKEKGEWLFFLLSLAAVSLCLLSVAFASNITHFIIIAVVYGVFQGYAGVLFQTMIIMKAPPSRRGLANSTFFLAFDAATAIGSVLWGAAADLFGTRTIYILASLLPLATLAVYAAKGKPKSAGAPA